MEEKERDKNLESVSISQEAKRAYLDYAMSVIVSRALPDVHDGLKPVQRRIIYAMHEQGMGHTAKFAKCAAVVGEVLKKYHPHGDSSVYDALVRMGQDFSLRYMLIKPQGNFGSVDGDPPAAMRYTECKLEKISQELLKDIEKDTVDFSPNYSGDYFEPEKLPSAMPNVLLNGAIGIAVGMATNIPPHNLNELMDALVYMVDNAEEGIFKTEKGSATTLLEQKENPDFFTPYARFESTATVEDLYKFIKGPDFPTGGTIYDKEEVLRYFATGKGRIIQRAKAKIEETKGGKLVIAITELPYLVNKASLVAQIANLVRNKKIDGISDLRDESDRSGLRVAVELKKGARGQRILNNLYKHTELQKSFNVNMVALVHKEPKLLTVKMVLEEFIRHRQIVVFRRTKFLLKKAREREHILQGLKIALDHIDEVIEIIKKSKDSNIAKRNLMEKFKLSEIQASAILDMQLRRLAALERKKIEDELADILTRIGGYIKLLSSTKEGLRVIKKELLEIKEKYGDKRKTRVIAGKTGEFSDEELIKEERVVVTISQEGYIKRLKIDSYKRQGRGGKGIKGAGLKKEDIVFNIQTCSTHDEMLFFTDRGKVYKRKVWEIPEASRQAKGTPVINVIDISQGETVTEMITIPKTIFSSKDYGKMNIIVATKQGTVKKTPLKDFANVRSSGIIAIRLQENDILRWARLTRGNDNIILVTKKGKAIKFNEKDARPMGRSARGVRGIKLHEGDEVVSMESIPEKDGSSGRYLLVITEKGYGKKTPIKSYPKQKRGGMGVKTATVTPKTGGIVDAKLVDKDVQDVIAISTQGQVIRLEAVKIARQGRPARGVILMRLNPKDSVSAVTLVKQREEKEGKDNRSKD